MNIHLIIGEDDYLVGETAKKIVGDGVGLEVVDSVNASNAELQLADLHKADESLSTPPFLDPKKVTWWKNVHFLPGGKCSEDVKTALERFAEKLATIKLADNQHFILSGPHLLKTSVFAKRLGTSAEVITFAAEKPWEAARNAVVRVEGSWSAEIENQQEFSRTFYFEGISPSDNYQQGLFSARWEPSNGQDKVATACFTVVCVTAEPICTEVASVPNWGSVICNPSAIVKGGRPAPFRISVLPDTFPDSGIRWNSNSTSVHFQGSSCGRNVLAVVDSGANLSSDEDVVVSALVGQSEICSISFPLRVKGCEKVVKIYRYAVADEVGEVGLGVDSIQPLIQSVNEIFAQAGVRFELAGEFERIFNKEYLTLDCSELQPSELYDRIHHADGISVCLVDKLINNYRDAKILGWCDVGHVFVCSQNLASHTLAHELGHALGLEDIYDKDAAGVLWDARPIRSYQPDDWNAHNDIGYYSAALLQRGLIKRLLMFGESGDNQIDIPLGRVRGYYYVLQYQSLSDRKPKTVSYFGNVAVGLNRMDGNETEVNDEGE